MAKPNSKGPGFFQRVRMAFSNVYTWDQMVRDWMSGNDVPPGQDVNVSGSNALRFTTVFSCLRVLGETFASVPFHEYKRIDVRDRERTDDTGLLDILHNAPNDEMSCFNWKEMGMIQLNTGGNFVCLRAQSQLGKIIELRPIEYNRVEIYRDRGTQKIVYKLDGKEAQIYQRNQVFHVPGMSINGVVGLSPIEYAAQAIRLGLTYERFGVNYYKNGIGTSGIFKHPGFLKDEAFKRLKEDLKSNYSGLINAGTPIIAEDGLDFVPVMMKLADAELLASKKFQVEDICRIYRVPLHLVQNLDKATFSNIEQQSLEFIMYTMLPWFKRWEQCIQHQLLTPQQRADGYYFEANMSALLRGDQKSMAEAFAIGRQWGWLSVNDIRRLLNMNAVPNGDIYLQPMNMIEAGTQIDAQTKAIVDEVHKLIEARRD